MLLFMWKTSSVTRTEMCLCIYCRECVLHYVLAIAHTGKVQSRDICVNITLQSKFAVSCVFDAPCLVFLLHHVDSG